jgi:hypothetical protein
MIWMLPCEARLWIHLGKADDLILVASRWLIWLKQTGLLRSKVEKADRLFEQAGFSRNIMQWSLPR